MLSDNFVKSNFKDFDKDYKNTAKDYTQYIRDNVVKDMAWESVYTKSDIKEYPEDLLERVKTQYRTPIVYYLKQNGTNLKDYLEMQSMTEEDFEKNVETIINNEILYESVNNFLTGKVKETA